MTVVSLQPQERLPQPLRDRPVGVPFIHSLLDESNLTLEAHRVFDHLARRARAIVGTGGQIFWQAHPSLDSIAQTCFRGSYPNSRIEVLRRKAISATRELVERGMLAIVHRQKKGVGTQSNLYYLQPADRWKESAPAFVNPNVRKGRSRNPCGAISRQNFDTSTAPPDPVDDHPPLITPGSTPDPLQDQEVFLYEGIPERERESLWKTPAAVEKPIGEQEADSADSLSDVQAIAQTSLEPQLHLDDISSAAVAPANFDEFDWQNYGWAQYQQAGDGGSDSEFWTYTQANVALWDKNQRARQKPGAGDLIAVTRTAIQTQGVGRYRAYLQSIGKLPPNEPKPASPGNPQAVQQKEMLAQWQQSSDRLKQLIEQSGIEAATDLLDRILKGNQGCPPDPDKIRWLLKQNPDWGITYEAGQLHAPLKAAASPPIDYSEINAEISISLKRLKWSISQVREDLERRYHVRSIAQLKDNDLTDFLYYLRQATAGGRSGG